MSKKKSDNLIEEAIEQLEKKPAAAKRRRIVRRSSEAMVLEPRVMFDGAALATAETVSSEDKTVQPVEKLSTDKSLFDVSTATPVDTVKPASNNRLILVSAQLQNLDAMLAMLSSQGTVQIIQGGADVLQEISNVLKGWTNISELHVVSHGESGGLVFGSELIDAADLVDGSATIES